MRTKHVELLGVGAIMPKRRLVVSLACFLAGVPPLLASWWFIGWHMTIYDWSWSRLELMYSAPLVVVTALWSVSVWLFARWLADLRRAGFRATRHAAMAVAFVLSGALCVVVWIGFVWSEVRTWDGDLDWGSMGAGHYLPLGGVVACVGASLVQLGRAVVSRFRGRSLAGPDPEGTS